MSGAGYKVRQRVLALAVSLVMFFSSAVPVSAIARAVTLNYSTLTLEEGGSAQLQMEIGGTRADAADWRSDNSSVAVVSSSGLVTAKSAGSAAISCDSGYGYRLECAVTVTGAQKRIVFPDRAAASSKYIYYALGVDGGGDIVRYNPANKKKKTLARGKYHSLTVKGKYIYCGLNKYGGTDETDEYIYKVSTNGKTKKKLADGMDPVVIGQYIYYLAYTKKTAYGKTKADDKCLGIYRMTLNGKGKKRIYGFSDYAHMLGTDGKNLFYHVNARSSWMKYTIGGSTASAVSITGLPTNVNFSSWYGSPKVTYGKTVYSFSGSYIYKTVSGSSKKVSKMKGTVKLIIPFKKHMFVVTENGTHYYGIIMTTKGKQKKIIKKGFLAGGGW